MKEKESRRVEQVMCDEGFSVSFGQARRLIQEKAVKIDGEVVELGTEVSPEAKTIQVGRIRERELKR